MQTGYQIRRDHSHCWLLRSTFIIVVIMIMAHSHITRFIHVLSFIRRSRVTFGAEKAQLLFYLSQSTGGFLIVFGSCGWSDLPYHPRVNFPFLLFPFYLLLLYLCDVLFFFSFLCLRMHENYWLSLSPSLTEHLFGSFCVGGGCVFPAIDTKLQYASNGGFLRTLFV